MIGTITVNLQTISTRKCPRKSGIGYAKLFSPENTPATYKAFIRLAAWRITLIFIKNFCIIYIQGKEKRNIPP